MSVHVFFNLFLIKYYNISGICTAEIMTVCGEKLGPEPVNPVCSVKSVLELTQTGTLDIDGEVTGPVIMHARSAKY